MAPSDFRNTYSIIGFCGIDRRAMAVRYRIHDNINNAEQFGLEIEAAIATGFLLAGDVLVLDNAAIHTGRENRVLPAWLWERFGVFVLFLPARTPEWNPMEQVWHLLVRRLKKVSLDALRHVGAHSVAYAAHHVLGGISHNDVYKMYHHSGLV